MLDRMPADLVFNRRRSQGLPMLPDNRGEEVTGYC